MTEGANNARRQVFINRAGQLCNMEGTLGITIPDSGAAGSTGNVSFGSNQTVTGVRDVTLGNSAVASSTDDVTIGTSTNNAAASGVVVGLSASLTAAATDGIAIGDLAAGTVGIRPIAIGRSAAASNTRATAIGSQAAASGVDSIAEGTATISSAIGTIALGVNSQATANNAIAIGNAGTPVLASAAGSAVISSTGVTNAAAASILLNYQSIRVPQTIVTTPTITNLGAVTVVGGSPSGILIFSNPATTIAAGTTNSAAVVTNSSCVSATSQVFVSLQSFTAAANQIPVLFVSAVGAGTFTINVANAGSASIVNQPMSISFLIVNV